MVEKGQCLKVKTTTLEDVFGTCYYEVTETGLPHPKDGGSDGMRCVMIGGSGPAARPGYEVVDFQEKVAQDIAAGTTSVITKEQALAMMEGSKVLPQQAPGDGVSHQGTGCLEIPS